MQKSAFLLLTLTCFSLCACQSRQRQAPQPPPVPTPLQVEQTQEYLPPPTVDMDVWNVHTTDVSKIDPTKKLIAFTYDDAPASSLESLLSVFLSYNEKNPDCVATATLFCNGKRIDEPFSHTLRSALALGFELGNHTYSHADLTKCTAEKIAFEIERTDSILQRLDGNTHHLFRAPYGNITNQVQSQVQTPVISWTIDTLDWTGKSAEDIYACVWEQKYSGAIVLMHDGYENTIIAMKRLLPDLKNAGYQAVTVSQMSKVHDCPLRVGSVYIRARKQKKTNSFK